MVVEGGAITICARCTWFILWAFLALSWNHRPLRKEYPRVMCRWYHWPNKSNFLFHFKENQDYKCYFCLVMIFQGKRIDSFKICQTPDTTIQMRYIRLHRVPSLSDLQQRRLVPAARWFLAHIISAGSCPAVYYSTSSAVTWTTLLRRWPWAKIVLYEWPKHF